MKSEMHDRNEAIAGAIALGEATDRERREYREHIASCSQCLNALGGEHEIERVAATVTTAREEEVWEPDLGDVVATRRRRRAQNVRWGVSFFSIALAASFGVHALLAAGIPKIDRANAPVVIDAGATRIVLEQNAPAAKSAPAAAVAAPPRRLVVTHNVVQIARAPVPAAAAPALPAADTKPRELVAITVHPEQVASSGKQQRDVPIWRRDDVSWRTVARTTTTSVTETAPQTLTHNAESIQMSANYVTRDVAPVGGETAINPQPPMIAYDEGAEGTTAFEVLVDERGLPTKCVVTKSAGYPVLDETVCKAAMKARYTPKLIDGRAVPGVYRDAFTFHMSDQSSDVEGVPQNIGQGVSAMRQPRASGRP